VAKHADRAKRTKEMNHVVTESSPGELGRGCKCGQRFPTLKAAEGHAADQNLIEANEAKAKQAEGQAAELAHQAHEAPEPAEGQEAKEPVADPDVHESKSETPTASKSAKSEKTVAREVATEPPTEKKLDDSDSKPQMPEPASEKGEKQVDFGALSPFDQTRLQVQKYATQIVGSKWGNEFMLNLTVISRNEPRIAKCSPESIIKALKACIDCRLMPNTYAQHAMVAPYWNSRNNTYELQFQLMKNGLIELARKSGQIRAINAELVFQGDEFDVELGTERRLHHKPDYSTDRTDASKVTHAYMTAVLENGERTFEVVARTELDKIKKVATAGKKGSPWDDWEPEMQKKTAKLLPSSPEMQKAIRYDSLEESGKLALTAGGELIEHDPDALPTDVEEKINAATSRGDLNTIIQTLPIAQRKAAVDLVQIRMRELA
jgi:phage RecT family recombinase